MFYSFLARGTLITLADETTKAVEELVKDDKVLTYNYSAKNHDGAHLENNELRVGSITNLIKRSIPRKDTIKVTLSNGNEIVVTKDFPLIGAGKATGWQVYDAFAYVKSHIRAPLVGPVLYSFIYKKVTTIKELEDFIKSQVEEINEMHAGIHPEATEWYSSGQPPNERADITKPGSMHPSGRQSGNFPGRLGVRKELYSWPIKVSEYEHITELEEQTGEDLEEMYCVNKVMIGHTIFANGFLVAACDWGYVWPDEFYINEGNYYPRGEDTMSDIFKVKVDDITMSPISEKLIKSTEDKSYSNLLPITVIRCSAKSKKWIVVDGHHRVLEARNNNITELDAVIHIPTE